MNTTSKPCFARWWSALLLGVTFGASFGVGAAEPGFYVGGLYGQISKDEDSSLLDAHILALYNELEYSPAVRSSRFDTDDTTWGFFGGYRLFQNLAFEAGYLSVGKDVLRESSSGSFVDENGENVAESWAMSVGVRSTGFAISALGVLPVTYNWELFARGGVFLASNTMSRYASNFTSFSAGDQITESSADFLAGVGAGYTLAEVYQLRAEYMRMFDAGAKEFGEADIDLLTVGITVRF
jgi:OmpA-like transmembrane domain